MGCGFRFNRVSKGNYFIHVKLEGYAEVRQAIDVGEGVMSGAPLVITMSPAPTRISRQKSKNVVDASELLEQYPSKAVDLWKKSIDDRKKGKDDKAIEKLEDMLQTNPRNRDVARLLIDCHIGCDRPDDAEQVLIKLVEYEPSNYEKFLELVGMFLQRRQPHSASRALAMCSEHMLMGGQSDELRKNVETILDMDANDLTAIRMLVRYCSWKRLPGGVPAS